MGIGQPSKGQCDIATPSDLPNSGLELSTALHHPPPPLDMGGASLIDQLVKNLPAMQETRVRSLSREDPLEKGVATHSSILARKSHGQRDTVHSVPKSQSQLSY